MIVSICDVYDALALKRSYKRDYPPGKIYEVMIMEKGRMFDPLLLDKFFQFGKHSHFGYRTGKTLLRRTSGRN